VRVLVGMQVVHEPAVCCLDLCQAGCCWDIQYAVQIICAEEEKEEKLVGEGCQWLCGIGSPIDSAFQQQLAG
jgi:hypothetical protein